MTSAPDNSEGVKRWPFVESPGEFADRLTAALQMFDGYVLGAVRNVLIEHPPKLVQHDAKVAELQAQLAELRKDQDKLSQCVIDQEHEIERLRDERDLWFGRAAGAFAFISPEMLCGDLRKAADEIKAKLAQLSRSEAALEKAREALETAHECVVGFGEYVSAVAAGDPPRLMKDQRDLVDQLQDEWNETAWDFFEAYASALPETGEGEGK